MIKFEKLSDKALDPVKVGNEYVVRLASVGMSPNEDNTALVMYSTDLNVTVPEGYIGLVMPVDAIAVKSTMHANSNEVILPGTSKKLIIPHKLTCGTALAHLFGIGEPLARIILVPVLDTQMEIIEYVEPVKEVENEYNTGDGDSTGTPVETGEPIENSDNGEPGE